jgi:hypothetical protein
MKAEAELAGGIPAAVQTELSLSAKRTESASKVIPLNHARRRRSRIRRAG